MKIRLTLFFVLVLFVSASAQPKYMKSARQEEEIRELISNYPSFDGIKLNVFGKTYSGANLYSVEIGFGDLSKKPGLLIVAGVEPDDLAGPLAAEEFLKFILNNSESDSVKPLIENYSLYIIPRLSPDPLDYFTVGKRNGNLEPYDDDKDGEIDEDDYNDLDGNGKITLMRIEHPDGKWIEDAEIPGRMRLADKRKGEIGKYLFFREGKDDDGDGLINEDTKGGVNVNRNFTNDYKPYTVEGGPYPFSSYELRAFGNYVFDRPNIIALFSFTFHNNISKLWKIKYPNKRGKPNLFAADSSAYVGLAKSLQKFKPFKGGKKPEGDISGWAYYDAGRISLTAPPFAYPEIKDSSKSGKRKAANPPAREDLAYKWFYNKFGADFFKWRKFNHPDFPDRKVEISDFDILKINNPDESMLSESFEKYNALLFQLYRSLPNVKTANPKIEKIGGGVSRVTLHIHNAGKMPSHTVAGIKLKSLKKFIIRTKLSDSQKFASGKKVELIDKPLQAGETIEKSFLIIGKGKVEFEIGSPSAGFKTIQVDL